MVAGTEYIRDLVIAVAHDRLLKRYQVGTELAKALSEHPPTLVPLSPPAPQVERGDVHLALGARLVHVVPPKISSAKPNDRRIVARTDTNIPQLPRTVKLREDACVGAPAAAVVATDFASVDADYDNGTALHS